MSGCDRLADRGVLVGFHFHPMIHYDRWREDYGLLFQRLLREFTTDEVVLVSFGTLTYIKSVIKQEMFGYDYPSNRAFEAAMQQAYSDKIRRRRGDGYGP
ncbi:MAG: hypothetical protein KZQ95_06095 [Candidatus Thiodiazotropha sp. (ex Epidulcina cf. delphinae)]|nr:hypothetical protein [Candidatus Thiodiazotropha sp. (ex Epidulcina cf. delphinae)]